MRKAIGDSAMDGSVITAIQLSQKGCPVRFTELSNIIGLSADVGSDPQATYLGKLSQGMNPVRASQPD